MSHPTLNKFLLFQPLKLFYQIQLELNQIQLKNSNAIRFLRIGTTSATYFRNYADSIGGLNPLLRGKSKIIETCQFFKPVEFHGFKFRIIELFPYT